jgi:hypothetical protein
MWKIRNIEDFTKFYNSNPKVSEVIRHTDDFNKLYMAIYDSVERGLENRWHNESFDFLLILLKRNRDLMALDSFFNIKNLVKIFGPEDLTVLNMTVAQIFDEVRSSGIVMSLSGRTLLILCKTMKKTEKYDKAHLVKHSDSYCYILEYLIQIKNLLNTSIHVVDLNASGEEFREAFSILNELKLE